MLSQRAENRALGLELSILGYSPGSAIHQLGDLEKFTFPLWAPIFSSVQYKDKAT